MDPLPELRSVPYPPPTSNLAVPALRRAVNAPRFHAALCREPTQAGTKNVLVIPVLSITERPIARDSLSASPGRSLFVNIPAKPDLNGDFPPKAALKASSPFGSRSFGPPS